MFRFSIRELLLLTLCVGMGLGWWLDHQRYAEAAKDARLLASLSANYGLLCGGEGAMLGQLQKKYGAIRTSSFLTTPTITSSDSN